jgi:hypothetical protein
VSAEQGTINVLLTVTAVAKYIFYIFACAFVSKNPEEKNSKQSKIQPNKISLFMIY